MLAIIVELTVIFAAGVAGYRGLRKWVAAQAQPAREANDRLRTANGRTIAQLVERTTKQLDDVVTLARGADDRSRSAERMAVAANERLDRHMVRDHLEGEKP